MHALHQDVKQHECEATGEPASRCAGGVREFQRDAPHCCPSRHRYCPRYRCSTFVPPNLLEYTMLKTAFVAACVLAVSGSVAFAQSRLQGPNEAPYGANGPA